MNDWNLDDLNDPFLLEYEYSLMADIIARAKFPLWFEVALTQYMQVMVRYRECVDRRKLVYRWRYLQDFRDNDALEFCFKPYSQKEPPATPTATRVWYQDDMLWYKLKNDREKGIRSAIDLAVFNMKWYHHNHNGALLNAYALRPTRLDLYNDD